MLCNDLEQKCIGIKYYDVLAQKYMQSHDDRYV